LAELKEKDKKKKEVAKAKGITLVIIPCWWDGTTERLFFTSSPSKNNSPLGIDSPPHSL